jgi:hypothetical protein
MKERSSHLSWPRIGLHTEHYEKQLPKTGESAYCKSFARSSRVEDRSGRLLSICLIGELPRDVDTVAERLCGRTVRVK